MATSTSAVKTSSQQLVALNAERPHGVRLEQLRITGTVAPPAVAPAECDGGRAGWVVLAPPGAPFFTSGVALPAVDMVCMTDSVIRGVAFRGTPNCAGGCE